MAAKKKAKRTTKVPGRGVVKKKGKKGRKIVVVKAPKVKTTKPKKTAPKKKKVAPTPKKAKTGEAVPSVVGPEDKPMVVMNPPPDEE